MALGRRPKARACRRLICADSQPLALRLPVEAPRGPYGRSGDGLADDLHREGVQFGRRNQQRGLAGGVRRGGCAGLHGLAIYRGDRERTEIHLPFLVRHRLRRAIAAGGSRHAHRDDGRFHGFRRSARHLGDQVQSAAVALPEHADVVLQFARVAGRPRHRDNAGCRQRQGACVARRSHGEARDRCAPRCRDLQGARAFRRRLDGSAARPRLSARRGPGDASARSGLRQLRGLLRRAAHALSPAGQQIRPEAEGGEYRHDGHHRSAGDIAALYARNPRNVLRDDAQVGSADRGVALRLL